jgi:hypothetical protein
MLMNKEVSQITNSLVVYDNLISLTPNTNLMKHPIDVDDDNASIEE